MRPGGTTEVMTYCVKGVFGCPGGAQGVAQNTGKKRDAYDVLVRWLDFQFPFDAEALFLLHDGPAVFPLSRFRIRKSRDAGVRFQ